MTPSEYDRARRLLMRRDPVLRTVIKQIGTRARPEIELLLGRQIFLELQVKTRPKWRRDAAMLERPTVTPK